MNKLRFFADHCVSNYIVQSLRKEGYEVFVLREHIPQDSKDTLVIEKAQELEAILLSLNGDFSDIVRYPPSEYRGIISLQIRNHPEITTNLMQKLTKYLAEHPDARHYKGRLFLAEVHRIRIRK